jgi:redox-sensitive bicupin YhaK (pirin superfamily)
MKTIIHSANSRGHADHGWLNTYHTFSFAEYYDPERIRFGALRVLNDDRITGGTGFGRHPHDNMEIVTIMLEGELRHGDSMGHTEILRPNEVQAMSAGTGIFHSEENNQSNQPARFLQIWIFPEKRNIRPRYAQKAFDPDRRKNKWQMLVSPESQNGELNIRQQAWFSRIDLNEGIETIYNTYNPDSGVYLFLISGKVSLEGNLVINRRDGAGISDTVLIHITAREKSELLAIEVPLV